MTGPTLETLACPHCGVGIALAIAADENGSNFKCFNCGLGFTKPASEDSMSKPPITTDTQAGSSTPGNPGPGSVLPDGTSAGRMVESKHPDAGPGSKAVSPTKGTKKASSGSKADTGAEG